MASFEFASHLGFPQLPRYLAQVETVMNRALAEDDFLLQPAMERLLRGSSKRLRPSLVLALATSQGQLVDKTLINAAAAVELVHIGSLVHDDIIDHAATRWNVPTISSKEGTDQAILAGDYFFATACLLASSISPAAGQLIARTIRDLCDGEAREVAEQFKIDRTIPSLTKAIRGKTAALISAACQLGGLCAGLAAPKIKILATYGESFGMSFQLIDDVLDLLSTPELCGKPVGNDIKEGVYTLPLLLSLQSPSAETIKPWLTKNTTVSMSEITDLLLKDGSIQKTITEAQKYNKTASSALKNLPNAARLMELPSTYLNWAFQNLVAEPYNASVCM